MKVKEMHSIKLTWAQLGEILKKQGNGVELLTDEEIKEITLVKPREILIRAEEREVK